MLDNGELPITPTTSPDEAQQIAIEMVEEENPDLEFEANDPNLIIYEPSVLGNSGATRLVWQTTVTSVAEPIVAEFVLVDAHSGKVALHYSLIKNARYRRIYDLYDTCLQETLRREEGDPPYVLIPDVDYAYDYLGDTYDFYLSYHGRDSINGFGMTMIADVRDCLPGASWYSGRMYFEEGYAIDDVAGHELTHGVTEYESDLVYLNESGAINESFSDMWGEWIDQTNGKGNDTSAVKWLMGEDLSMGAIRDMENPPVYSDPDRMGSPYWYTGSSDNGGVHTNCGVGNKLCYLLTDGDTFNGYSVTGMGIAKVADLFYEVQTSLLSSGADYADLYAALTQAAINLGWTAAEKQSLEQACQAVEITGGASTVVFEDTFPSTTLDASKWTDTIGTPTTDIFANNEPSSPYSLHLEYTDTVISRTIDLSGASSAQLTYYWQRYSTESGDDLYVDYWDGASWQRLRTHLYYEGSTILFSEEIIDLPIEVLHAGFRVRFQASCSSTADEWYIDDVSIKTTTGGGYPTFEDFESGDFSSFPWIHSGNTNWIITSGEKNSGNYSAQAGIISNSQSSSLEVTLDCVSGNIEFYRKVSSEATYDKLKFYIDEVEVDNWSGFQDWSQVSYPVSAGTRTFKWTYSKDGSLSSGSDTAWIDDITFPIERGGDCDTVTIGTDTATLSLPMFTIWHDSRTQIIYLANEMNGNGTITALALNVASVPGQTMNNWTIRMKHTSMDSYTNPSLDSSGWTIVYQGDESVGSPGWRTFTFSTPFEYNGIDNLLVDFSFNNSSNSLLFGTCRVSTPGGTRTAYANSNSSYGDPLNWSGTTSPSVYGTSDVPNIQLTICGGSYIGDFDGDGDVDMMDLDALCESWLTDDTIIDIAPAEGDGIVNMRDFAAFARSWSQDL